VFASPAGAGQLQHETQPFLVAAALDGERIEQHDVPAGHGAELVEEGVAIVLRDVLQHVAGAHDVDGVVVERKIQAGQPVGLGFDEHVPGPRQEESQGAVAAADVHHGEVVTTVKPDEVVG
jgi:hypothetical protein